MSPITARETSRFCSSQLMDTSLLLSPGFDQGINRLYFKASGYDIGWILAPDNREPRPTAYQKLKLCRPELTLAPDTRALRLIAYQKWKLHHPELTSAPDTRAPRPIAHQNVNYAVQNRYWRRIIVHQDQLLIKMKIMPSRIDIGAGYPCTKTNCSSKCKLSVQNRYWRRIPVHQD